MKRVSPRLRRVLAAGVLTVSVFYAGAAFLTGITLDGMDAPAVQCTRNAPVPEHGGPYTEATVVTGARTFLPLGVNCGYDAPGDGYGPQTVVNSNWGATFFWIGCIVVAIYAVRELSKSGGSPQRRGGALR
jgi:hypothetical protein